MNDLTKVQPTHGLQRKNAPELRTDYNINQLEQYALGLSPDVLRVVLADLQYQVRYAHPDAQPIYNMLRNVLITATYITD